MDPPGVRPCPLPGRPSVRRFLLAERRSAPTMHAISVGAGPTGSGWLGRDNGFVTTSSTNRASGGSFRPGDPLTIVLRQLRQVGMAVSDEQYSETSARSGEGSIGAHLRHCLDHVQTFLDGVRTGRINYDQRRRGTAVETDRRAGVAAIDNAIRELAEIRPEALAQPVEVTTLLDCEGPPIQASSSIGRELSFVISHTIHHNAVVAVAVRALGVALPVGFGYAPSTIAYRQQQERSAVPAVDPCVR